MTDIKPNWIEFYMGLAFAVSQKSHDTETQHGCIITDRQNRVLGMGYNGFPRGIDDTDLPATRPDKYPWMFHSEENAVANCTHRPENGIAYVTGQCCNRCIFTLWQNGVTTVYMSNRHGTFYKDISDLNWFNEFVKKTGINIHYVNPGLSWLKNIGDKVVENGFFNE